jgi:hypothetical protein
MLAATLAPDADVILLAQALLAPLRDGLAGELPCPVPAGPPLLMRELALRLACR